MSMNEPISIVIPLYNKEKYIGRAIRSVLDQSYINFELVVVDDGSIDHSLKKVREFEDKRIRIIQQRNLGISAARNSGICHCTHPLVAFLDADDYWEETFLENINALANEFPQAGLYSTGYYLHYEDMTTSKVLPMQAGKTRFIINNYFEELVKNTGWGLHTSSVVIRKRVLEELGLFPVVFSSPAGYLYLTDSGNLLCKARSGFDPGFKGLEFTAEDAVMVPEELKHIPDLYLVKSIPGEEFYLWNYIAAYYPIAYSSQLLSNFSGNIPDQDSRIKVTVFCATIDNLYRQIHRNNGIKHIKYIKKYLRRVLVSFIIRTLDKKTLGDLFTCLDANHADYLMPILNRLARRKIFYPIFYWAICYERYKQSRKVFKVVPRRLANEFLIKVMGGRRR